MPFEDPRLTNVAAKMLRELGTLPEQINPDLPKILAGKRSKLRIGRGDFEAVIANWIAGATREVIFAGLPSVRRSSIKPGIETWMNGTVAAEQWDVYFDKFIDFTNMVIEGFLPWTMRACARLSTIAGGWSSDIDWREFASRLLRSVEPDNE